MKMAKGNRMVTGFILGAVAGAAVGLMIAPKAGKETREMLRQRAGKVQHRAGEALGALRSKIGTTPASS